MENKEYKLKEECGVFGVYDVDNAPLLTSIALHSLQHRGQDSAGIAWVKNGRVDVFKAPGLVSDVFKHTDFAAINCKHAIGHVRYATTGGQNLSNIHPFVFYHSNRAFALAHNGNISNAPELRQELEDKGAVFSGDSDSEVVGHLLVREKGEMINAIQNVAKKLEGAFSFVFIDNDAVYALRDKIGFRPLSLGKIDGKYTIASESVAFDVIGGELIRPIKPGEIIKIGKDGIESKFYEENREPQIDAMEFVYFSRPDSIIEGLSVQDFRKESGRILAQEAPISETDLIVPVPDSSIEAALGFSEISGIPFEFGLIKNRYIARTFIQPTQNARKLEVNKKLNPSPVIRGKNITLIDDSVVRGTTLKRIVEIVKNAGAKRVDVRIASPKIIAPSYYGINISTYKELISHNLKTNEELADFLGADSIKFLSIEGMKKAAQGVQLETCIFTDEYQTKISPELLERARDEK